MPHVILRPYWHKFINRFTKAAPGQHQFKKDLILIGMAVLTMVCIFTAFVMILSTLRSNPLVMAVLPKKLIELMCYVFFLLLLLSNTVAAVGHIFSSHNMDLLLTAPVSSFRLYTAKLLEMIAETGTMFVVFGFPALLGFVYALDVSPRVLLAGALVTVPFIVIPAGISVVIGSLFVRFASVFWKRGALLIAVLAILLVWVGSEILKLFAKVHAEKGGTEAILRLIGFFDNPNPIWLPSRWAADILSAQIGTPGEMLDIKSLLLISTAIGSFTLGYVVFDLYALKVRSQNQGQGKVQSSFKRFSDIGRFIIEGLVRFYPVDQQTRAIILKDLSSMLRDRAQSLQLLIFVCISALYLVVFKFTSAALHLAPVAFRIWQAFLASTNILFAGFILTAMMTRLVYPSVSLEGRALWILLVSPMELRSLIFAKYRCWLPVCMGFILVLLSAGALAIGIDFGTSVCIIVMGSAYAIGITGLAVGLGSIFASFEWEAPNQISSGLGTLVLLLSSLSLVCVLLVPSAAVIFLGSVPELRDKVGVLESYGIIAASITFVVFINIFIANWFCRLGARSLAAKQVLN